MRLSIGDLTTGLAFWHCAQSMRNRVYKTVRCPSVSQSVPSVSLSRQSNAAAACGGFAAKRRTRKRYRSTAPVARQQPGAAARRSAANAGNVMLTAELKRLNTDLGYFLFWAYFLAVFTACVEFVSGWQHARNYIWTHYISTGLGWIDGQKSPVFRRGKSGNSSNTTSFILNRSIVINMYSITGRSVAI